MVYTIPRLCINLFLGMCYTGGLLRHNLFDIYSKKLENSSQDYCYYCKDMAFVPHNNSSNALQGVYPYSEGFSFFYV